MKSEVFLPDFDFRDFLPMIDRAIFKSPFNPLEVWKKLGNNYNFAMWARALKKYRVRLNEEITDFVEVAGEIDEDYKTITLLIHHEPKIDDVNELKFLLIQTMMHEYIHMNQFHAHEEQYEKLYCDGVPSDEDEEYLCKFGEIQAFAHCAALDAHNSRSDTQMRYVLLSEKTKRVFYSHMFRWINKYSNKYSISNVILIEKNESNQPDPSSS